MSLVTAHQHTTSDTRTAPYQYVHRKVPEITAAFWIVKLLTTAMGEATSDFLVAKFNPYVAVTMGFVVFALALIVQFAVRRYIAWVYWFAVSMVAVFGTMAADGLHIQLGVPYIAAASLFAIALVAVFTAWQRSERTLSIHSITTRRREIFYWLTILATFALGTALGDLTATTFGLGYFSAGIVFAGLFLLPAIIYWFTRKHEVLCFWAAYVLTRPLGASVADWAGKPKNAGGLGYGDGHVAVVLACIIIIMVGCLALNRPGHRTPAHTRTSNVS
jgi:uncharacterized membrane-anchored protein